MKNWLPILFLIFAGTVAAQVSVAPLLGNPSAAVSDISGENNYLVAHRSFTLSYNRARGAANWVFWHLSKSDTQATPRTNAFAPDQSLPREWWITPSIYSGSDYDRGHMCPSDDRTNTTEANTETFLMSNMQPQTHHLNAGVWKSLEDYTRKQVAENNLEAYIYAGCYGNAGKLKDKVVIPTRCWKIVLFLPEGDEDLNRIVKETRVIAVDMDNTNATETGWRNHKVSVDEIEERMGYDFFAPVPDEIENVIEARKDRG